MWGRNLVGSLFCQVFCVNNSKFKFDSDILVRKKQHVFLRVFEVFVSPFKSKLSGANSFHFFGVLNIRHDDFHLFLFPCVSPGCSYFCF